MQIVVDRPALAVLQGRSQDLLSGEAIVHGENFAN